MAINGIYLVVKVEGEVIAETTNVSMKMVSKAIDTTTQSSGVSAEFMPGKIKIGMAGAFFYVSDGNWDKLYGYINGGVVTDVTLYFEGSECMNGYGLIKKLSLKGADRGKLITGAYGIRFYVSTVSDEGQEILTEAGLWITTEDGKRITTEKTFEYLLNDTSQIMTDDNYTRIYVDV